MNIGMQEINGEAPLLKIITKTGITIVHIMTETATIGIIGLTITEINIIPTGTTTIRI
jgi:hypothetical protein